MELLYVVPAMYPFGCAYSARALNLTRIATNAGCHVTVLCDYYSDEILKNEDGCAKYEKVKIIATTKKYASKRTLKDKLSVGIKMKGALEEYLAHNHIDIIMCAMTGGKYPLVQKIAKEHNIPIILEVCEWYSHRNWSLGYFDPRFVKFSYDWKNSLTKAKRVLCISRLLENHFSKDGVNTVRIPTVLNVDSITSKNTSEYNKPIKLVFVGGITGGKDELATLIDVICSNDLPFELNIYGPNENTVRSTLKKIKINEEVFNKRIFIHGFINQRQVIEKIRQSDYGILIRPNRRSSNAAFPTKLGEYFAAGVPVIANDTGDICLYLKDGENAIILKSNSRDDIQSALHNIEAIGDKQYEIMSEKARNTAEEAFDYGNYINDFKKLL